MGLKRIRIDSIAEENAKAEEQEKLLAEQAYTIELLKGCIMELADALFGGEEPTHE